MTHHYVTIKVDRMLNLPSKESANEERIYPIPDAQEISQNRDPHIFAHTAADGVTPAMKNTTVTTNKGIASKSGSSTMNSLRQAAPIPYALS